MNRRSIFAFLLVLTAALQALGQDKAATPKADKPAEKPKVLIFQPTEKAAANTSGVVTMRGEVMPRAATANPMADGPAQMVADFFASLREGKVDEGYNALAKDSKIAEKPEELKQLKAKTREAVEVFGAISGYDFVESRAIGQRLVRATYISQGKVFPLRWRFYFYKPENAWRLIDMRVDDKLTGLFDEPEEAKADDAKSGSLGLP